MQSLTIAGNIGKDAETRTAGSGTVTGFSVAVEFRENGQKGTNWYDVSIWGKRGESLAPYLRKGVKVTVSGTFRTREHDGKTYLKLNANEVTLQGGNQSSGDGQSGYDQSEPSQGGYGSAPAGGAPGGDDDQEIPFAPCVL